MDSPGGYYISARAYLFHVPTMVELTWSISRPFHRETGRIMGSEDIQELVRRQPFRPFRITLTDGRTYDVRHPELAMVGRSTVAIGLPANGDETIYDRLVTVELLHIMQTEHVDTPGRT
jgi:hypothetical protein